MGETEVQVFRPYKVVAVIMILIAFILMIVSVAGPNWMEVSFDQGVVKSWGLWWDCFKVNDASFLEMCVQTDWLFACAALMLIGLLCMLATCITGSIGLYTQKRLLYIISACISIFASVLQIICLIIYPVKFMEEVKADKKYRAETQSIDLDWTYGVACGAVFFMVGAAIMFLIPVDMQKVTHPKENSPPPAYLSYTRA